MSDLSKSERDAFHAKAAEVAKAFAESEPPATYVDPDPASTVNPHPGLAAVEQLVKTTAPNAFGGAYEDEHGIVHVGLTGGAGLLAGALQTALPNAEFVIFNARYPWSKLVATTDEITKVMSSQPALLILSAGPDVKRNVVTVGVTDLDSPIAKALAAQYGDLVSIFKDDPLELRADPVAPGRDKRRNPVLGGLNITSPGSGSCSSGFDYGPPVRQDLTGTAVRIRSPATRHRARGVAHPRRADAPRHPDGAAHHRHPRRQRARVRAVRPSRLGVLSAPWRPHAPQALPTRTRSWRRSTPATCSASQTTNASASVTPHSRKPE